MSENTPKYLVRDAQGNVYGPADEAMLREWVQQGRIVAGMDVAPRETREWVEASTHPALADLLLKPEKAEPLEKEPIRSAEVASVTPLNTVAPTKPVTPVVAATRPAPVSPPTSGTQAPVTRSAGSTMPYLGSVAYPPVEGPRVNVPAMIALIAGIVGLVAAMCPCAFPLSGLLGVTAITLACIGFYQMKLNPVRYTGPGLSIAGLMTGALAALAALGWVVYFFLEHLRHP